MEKFNPIHQHLLVKMYVTTPITTPSEGKSMLLDIVERIGMVPVTPPQSVYVDFPGNEGLTGSINLATSHIAYHCWDEQRMLMLDVYSCRNFETEDVLDVVADYFGELYDVHYVTLDRDDFSILDK
jgi:S-adenosylmethionine/arginine decarboxylase-like enzyme